MNDCCQSSATSQRSVMRCPICNFKGKSVQLITLKALLIPSALERLDPEASFAFCPNSSCSVVYFTEGSLFDKGDLKVPVYQKDEAPNVFVCYCFGWTREKLFKASQQNVNPIDQIRGHVQANRCGCEVNNPQGSCCLGNVTKIVNQWLGKIDKA